MIKRLNPTQILLKDVPPEGRELVYSQESGELDAALKDIVGENPYLIRLEIAPLGGAFQLKGRVTAAMNLQCSLCAQDFKFPVDLALDELLMVRSPIQKGDHESRVNHSSEMDVTAPGCTYLDSDLFDVGEYIHEVIALEEPMRPLGGAQCEAGCENLQKNVQREWLSVGSEEPIPVKANPFSVLGKLKK